MLRVMLTLHYFALGALTRPRIAPFIERYPGGTSILLLIIVQLVTEGCYCKVRVGQRPRIEDQPAESS
jgi:hypothetical protein